MRSGVTLLATLDGNRDLRRRDPGGDGNVTGLMRGDTTDDAARWWRAYQLAESDQVDELRGLAAGGDDEASRQLASWLSDRAYPRGVADPANFVTWTGSFGSFS